MRSTGRISADGAGRFWADQDLNQPTLTSCSTPSCPSDHHRQQRPQLPADTSCLPTATSLPQLPTLHEYLAFRKRASRSRRVLENIGDADTTEPSLSPRRMRARLHISDQVNRYNRKSLAVIALDYPNDKSAETGRSFVDRRFVSPPHLAHVLATSPVERPVQMR